MKFRAPPRNDHPLRSFPNVSGLPEISRNQLFQRAAHIVAGYAGQVFHKIEILKSVK